MMYFEAGKDVKLITFEDDSHLCVSDSGVVSMKMITVPGEYDMAYWVEVKSIIKVDGEPIEKAVLLNSKYFCSIEFA